MPAAAWSTPSSYTTTGVHHRYSTARVIGGGHRQPIADLFAWVIDDYESVHSAELTRLGPGGFIVPHRDKGPWRERWQIPIHTAGTWGEDVKMEDGVPFRVEHWLPHSVWNPTGRPRVHLLVDMDRVIDRPPAPLETYPIPARFTELVVAAQAVS